MRRGVIVGLFVSSIGGLAFGAAATRIQPAEAPKASAAQEALATKELGTKASMPAVRGAARFQQGDVFELPFEYTPNACFAAVAASEGGVTEVDLEIRLQIQAGGPLNRMVLAYDETTGPTAAFGGASDKRPCKTFPGIGRATLRVTATGGSGAIVFGLYRKS